MATMVEVRRIAWSIFWKAGLLGFAGGLAAGAVFGFIVGVFGTFFGVSEVVRPVATWGGWILGLIASFFALNWALAHAIGKDIGGRRLDLARPMQTGEGL